MFTEFLRHAELSLFCFPQNVLYFIILSVLVQIQWNLELQTQSVPGDGSTFKLFDFRVKFPHKK
jgi:hypothetical protein